MTTTYDEKVDALLNALTAEGEADGQTVESINRQVAEVAAARKAQNEANREKDAAAAEAEAAETTAGKIVTPVVLPLAILLIICS